MTEKLWREADPEFDDDGVLIKGGMFAHQRDLWNMPNFIKAMVAGYGSGKSFTLGKRAISCTLHNSARTTSPFMCVSPSYKQAKRTIIPAIKQLLEGRRIRYKFNKTDNEFRIWRNQRVGLIWIGSGEDPDALKGPNLCGAGIDEPFIQHKDVFMQMLARVRDPVAIYREILLTGTPEDLNWGYDICAGDEADRYDLGVIHASSMDNRALPKEFTETLNNAYDDKMRASYLNGLFTAMSAGRIYYGFTREKNLIAMPDNQLPLHVGMDFNINPMTACVFWTEGERMHVLKEYELEGFSNTEELVKQIWSDFPNRIVGFFPDASGNSGSTNAAVVRTDFTIIKTTGVVLKGSEFQIFAPLANPARRDRFNCVNKKLHDGTLTFDPSCKRLAKYCEQLTYENIKKQEQMTHLTDALGYPVSHLYNMRPAIEQGRRFYK